MKNAVILFLLVGLAGLTGCGKSAQEKVAEEQQMKTQKEVVAGFQKAADDARQAAKK